jgi:phosphotransacetylase
LSVISSFGEKPCFLRSLRISRSAKGNPRYAAAAKALELVRLGKAGLLMKGSLHTDELLAEVVRKDTGLRTRPRRSLGRLFA